MGLNVPFLVLYYSLEYWFFSLFFLIFFISFNSILHHYIYWELCFIIFFYLFFIRLFWIYNSNCRFDSTYFLAFSNWFFLNFIIQHWIGWELDFVICFSLHSMRLSSSHDSSHVFGGLILVDSSFFFVSFLIEFFQYYLQHWIDWELNFIIYWVLPIS